MSGPGPSTDRTIRGPVLHDVSDRRGSDLTAPVDPDAARRAVSALERLRSQLAETQDVLDDFLTRLDDAARTRLDED